MKATQIPLSLRSALVNLLLAPRAAWRRFKNPATLAPEDWEDLKQMSRWLRQHPAPAPAVPQQKTLLLVSFLPLPYTVKLESMIARAMQQRGYRIVVLTNLSCRHLVSAYHGDLHGFEIVLIEEFLRLRTENPLRELFNELFSDKLGLMERLKAFRYRSAYTGRHSLATLSATIVDGKIAPGAEHQRLMRKLLRNSALFTDAAYRIIEHFKPDLLLGVEKGFVSTSEIFYAALEKQIPYVQWVSCHEPNSIMLKRYSWHNFRDHPFSLSAKSWETVLGMPWSPQHAQAIMEQFESGYKDGAWFKHKYLDLTGDQKQRDRDELVRQLNLDPAKKTVVIYSHILNDANLFYGKDLFSGGFEEWLTETVRVAEDNPHVNWILKVHPANVFRNAKLGYTGKYGEIVALERALGKIPEFLRVVYPEEKTSPLSFFKMSDYGITVRGTVGLEMPSFGIPTLTAGTGRYSGKGFTIDSDSKEEYLERIRNIQNIPPLTEAQIELGQRYAYYIFQGRPARYGKLFQDVYTFPVKHPRHRDIALGETPFSEVLAHKQMKKITDFLSSDEEDFLDFEALPNYAVQ